MKQHITLEQLREINSDFIAEKLVKNGYIRVRCDELIRVNPVAKQFTIGKMIEILKSQKTFNDTFEIGYECYSRDNLDLFTLSNGVDYYDENESLCDLLWEAVKDVLKGRL